MSEVIGKDYINVSLGFLRGLLDAPGCLVCGGPVGSVAKLVCLCADCDVYDLQLANFCLDNSEPGTCVIIGALAGECVNDLHVDAFYWPEDFC